MAYRTPLPRKGGAKWTREWLMERKLRCLVPNQRVKSSALYLALNLAPQLLPGLLCQPSQLCPARKEPAHSTNRSRIPDPPLLPGKATTQQPCHHRMPILFQDREQPCRMRAPASQDLTCSMVRKCGAFEGGETHFAAAGTTSNEMDAKTDGSSHYLRQVLITVTSR